MKTIRVLALPLLLVWSSSVFAMSWGELEQEISAVEAGQPANAQLIARLAEIMLTLAVYTKEIHRQYPEGKEFLFCLPESNTVHLDQVVSLIREYARRNKVAADAIVQLLLVSALKQKHPCS